jgi:uroporphyrinogen III methyltransferase / synthase
MKSLAGQRILLTRAEEDCAEWAAELAARGAEAVIFPCIECHAIDDSETRSALARALPASDWLVFTSRRGVAAFSVLTEQPLPGALKIAVVGPATAKLARELLGRVDLVSPQGTAASLAAALSVQCARDATLMLAVAENAGDTIETELAPRGVHCIRVNVYRTASATAQTPRQALSALGVDNIFLASPSAVTGFVQRLEIDTRARVFSIGPATSRAARQQGLEVTREAREPTLNGLLEAMQCAN